MLRLQSETVQKININKCAINFDGHISAVVASGLLLLTARGGGVPDVSHFECLQLEHFLLTVLGLQQEYTLLEKEGRERLDSLNQYEYITTTHFDLLAG